MSTTRKDSTDKPTVTDQFAAVFETLPLSTHGGSLSRNGLTPNRIPGIPPLTPVGLLMDLKEELSGIAGLVAMLTAYTTEVDYAAQSEKSSMGVYRVGEYIQDQLETIQELLSVLHGLLPDSFDA